MGPNGAPLPIRIRLTLLCDDEIMDERTSDVLEIRGDFAGLAEWVRLFDQRWSLTPEAYGPATSDRDDAWNRTEWDTSWLINYRRCLAQHANDQDRCRAIADEKRAKAKRPEYEHPEIEPRWF